MKTSGIASVTICMIQPIKNPQADVALCAEASALDGPVAQVVSEVEEPSLEQKRSVTVARLLCASPALHHFAPLTIARARNE